MIAPPSSARLTRRPALSPALSTGLLYAAFGAAFAGGNLLAARALERSEYGRFALFLAVTNVGMRIAPLGLDGMVNRYPLRPGAPLVRRFLAGAIPVAILVTALASLLYPMPAADRGALFTATLAGGAAQLAAALLQARHRFGASVAVDHGSDLAVVLAGAAALALGLTTATAPIALVVAGILIVAVAGPVVLGAVPMARMAQTTSAGPGAGPGPATVPTSAASTTGLPFSWSESLAYAGIVGGALTMQALDRLAIPRVLSLEALATFGVLAVFTIAPLHVLQLGVERTILPRLRRARDRAERVRILRREALAVAVVAVGVGLLAVVLAPPAARLLLAGKYELGAGLVATGVAVGLLRVAAGFARAVPAALGTPRDLARLNLWAWVAVGAGVLGAVAGRPGGLAGVILGTGAGWLVLIVAGAAIGAARLGDGREST